jgi:hypothetical protein
MAKQIMDAPLVLDIDFDYCVTPTLRRGYSDPAALPDAMSLWLEPEELISWLDARGLLCPDTLAGVVRRHEQVLPVWLRLIRQNQLAVPFMVLHIDAHPDLMDLPTAEIQRFQDQLSVDDLISYAKSGDFLQYAVRLGWTKRIWMLYPDREETRIAVVVSNPETAAQVVRKPVLNVLRGAFGGGLLTILVGGHQVEVGLFTRSTLPPVSAPVATVVAESPEFTPRSSAGAFHRLTQQLRGCTHA